MVEKTVTISGQNVKFKASAAVPRLYRTLFHRDVFKDMTKLEKSMKRVQPKKDKNGKEIPQKQPEFEVEDLEIFENLAYAMAYHADHSIPKNIDDWLDQFDMFSIYQILPELLSLWGENMVTEVESKKNLAKVSGK